MRCNARQLENGKCGLTGEGCIGETCMYHEPGQTNGDRIRAMSDRELAAFFEGFNICDQRSESECKITFCAHCSDCTLDWLQQPADSPERDAWNAGFTARAIDDRPYDISANNLVN